MTKHRLVIEHDDEIQLASIERECECDVCCDLQAFLRDILEEENGKAAAAERDRETA